ncbi:uncharacterized protein ZC262.2 [Nilaparvata lugens]|uniref:uncharacterized protein ZC262.2 n=1 Tax=Nilaparvata lugens TaxID=108931 RepID=UPI00193D2470|nr:uncharacterized protein ZC262.2 [Nilaparvata lugens]
MESLFNYESDEDSQDKDEEPEELDANYDSVAMEMSSDDEEKSSPLESETKTCLSSAIESSEISGSDSISCSSDGSHGIVAMNITKSQNTRDESNGSRKRKLGTEGLARLSSCSSSLTNSKKLRYEYDDSSRSSEKFHHQGSTSKYSQSHSRRYSRESDNEKNYRLRCGESDDERSELRTSSVENCAQKLGDDHSSQTKDSTMDMKLSNNCNRSSAYSTKYADQVQKRKLLWSGEKQGTGCESKAETISNHWKDAKFSQDTDGRLRAKFKRLMGMKPTEAEAQFGSGTSSTSTNDSMKKQEEMFNSMEMQYEVARVSTHTHRGLGLGFGLHQFPR